jgi:hypothetical protein
MPLGDAPNDQHEPETSASARKSHPTKSRPSSSKLSGSVIGDEKVIRLLTV